MTSFTKEKTGLSYNRTYKYVSILGLKFIGKRLVQYVQSKYSFFSWVSGHPNGTIALCHFITFGNQLLLMSITEVRQTFFTFAEVGFDPSSWPLALHVPCLAPVSNL